MLIIVGGSSGLPAFLEALSILLPRLSAKLFNLLIEALDRFLKPSNFGCVILFGAGEATAPVFRGLGYCQIKGHSGGDRPSLSRHPESPWCTLFLFAALVF